MLDLTELRAWLDVREARRTCWLTFVPMQNLRVRQAKKTGKANPKGPDFKMIDGTHALWLDPK